MTNPIIINNCNLSFHKNLPTDRALGADIATVFKESENFSKFQFVANNLM